ncbi:MAG: hypothetical protein ACREIF_05610 [Chthoniobacterales bacterium]
MEALEHAQNVSQADAAEQRREINNLKAALKAQAAQIQKVSDQLAASRTTPPIKRVAVLEIPPEDSP